MKKPADNKPARAAWAEAAALALVLALCVIAYLPSFGAGWHFDDPAQIVNNPAVHMKELSASALARAITESPLKNRPLAFLSFALDHYRGGLEPRVFHQTNMALHLLATVITWLFLRELFQHPMLGERVPWPRPMALLGAAVFALHPIQVQSVTYIVQRMNLMAGLFTMAALLALFLMLEKRPASRNRLRAVAALAVACSLLALLSKENAAMVLPLALSLDYCRERGGLAAWARPRWKVLVPLFIAGAAVSVLYHIGSGGIFTGYSQRDFTMAERLMTQPRVIMLYISLLVMPPTHRLNIDHDIVTSAGPLTPLTTLPAIAVIVGLTALALAKKDRAPLAALGWLWFIGGLLLESSVLPLEMAFEHRLYIPMIGLIMVAAEGAGRARLGRASLAVALAALALFAANTRQRNLDWKDTYTLWADAAKKSPLSFRPWSNLCAGAMARGRVKEAVPYCQKGILLNPDDGGGWYNLGLCYYRLRLYKDAERMLVKSAEIDPGWDEGHYQLGRTRANLGRYKEAAADIERAIEIDPADPVYWYWLGVVRNAGGDAAGGRKALLEARERARQSGDSAALRDIENAIGMMGGE